ncbi:perlwapin-like [Bufo bufo]|uniref:perlwapin-like n=1 Tax=Bufo bufo TaxID=8384 RepID=UPI001ABDD0CD|nr:perlwapin-like [Bufo bufo]
MTKMGHISVLLFLLLSLCSLVISTSVKNHDSGLYNKITNMYPGNTKPGSCPPQRYYIKSENEICHKLCMRDDGCIGDMKCCPDNCHYMCKPPSKVKPGTCPSFETAFSSTVRCNDNCTSDSECPGTFKCCKKACGNTCVPTLADMGKPSMESTPTARSGFCPQESLSNCLINERQFCDEASCIDGYKCCPKICRSECQKPLQARAGECPESTQCPSQTVSKACSSDYDCPALFKCCSTCGNTCVKALNVPSFLHTGNGSIVIIGGKK